MQSKPRGKALCLLFSSRIPLTDEPTDHNEFPETDVRAILGPRTAVEKRFVFIACTQGGGLFLVHS